MPMHVMKHSSCTVWQGNQVMLNSRGGYIRGAITAGSATLLSKGGSVQLKSLIGQTVKVESIGGPIGIGACYVENACIKSGT